jgi:hypothetical protein
MFRRHDGKQPEISFRNAGCGTSLRRSIQGFPVFVLRPIGDYLSTGCGEKIISSTSRSRLFYEGGGYLEDTVECAA